METENELIEEIAKSENGYQIKPTENINFFRIETKKTNKNVLFSNDILKNSLEQSKDNTVVEKSLNKSNSEINITKLNTSLYKNQIKNLYQNTLKFKKLKESPKENENSNTSKIFNEALNICRFLNNISILKRYRNLNKKSSEYNLYLSQNHNVKKKEVNIKKITFMPKTLKDLTITNTRKKVVKVNKININFKIKEAEENKTKSNILKMSDLNAYNNLNSLENDSINLNNKYHSIIRLKISSYQNKLKYLFDELTEKKFSNTSKKKTKIIIKLNNRLRGSKIKDNSKFNKIIYNINDKCDLPINPNLNNSSFFEDTKNIIDGKLSLSSIYNKIIINNKLRKPNNIKLKLNPFKLGQLKSIYFPNIQYTPKNKKKSFCLPNKISLINGTNFEHKKKI